MTPIQFELARGAVFDAFNDHYEVEYAEDVEYAERFAAAAVQNIVDAGLIPDNTKKLSAQDVRDMRAAHKRGTSQADLARQYSVNSATVSRIVRGIYF